MLVNVTIHESQFPEQVQEQLKHSLRTRQINHKFHYQTYRQAEKWRALHQAYAPLEKNPSNAAIYAAAFQRAAETVGSAQVVGLCCGYAEKESRLLQRLQETSGSIAFVACDASLPMVLRGAEAAGEVIGAHNCQRLVCDLQAAPDLPKCLPPSPSGCRLLTFFGSAHNFEPELIFSRLAGLLQMPDLLLLSANLAPGPDAATAMKSIVPQYANALTFEWLSQLLLDLGFSLDDGQMRVKVEPCLMDPGLLRIAISYQLTRKCTITLEGERFDFQPDESLRLFYSYRYTPQRICDWLSRYQLSLLQQWVGDSGQEGVFLCGRR